MGSFKYNDEGICSYAPIYILQHPDYCNLNLIIVVLIMASGYGLLLLANHVDAQKERESKSD